MTKTPLSQHKSIPTIRKVYVQGGYTIFAYKIIILLSTPIIISPSYYILKKKQ